LHQQQLPGDTLTSHVGATGACNELKGKTQGSPLTQGAITADTDNTQSSARAGFADFHFVAASSACEQR
jgi:hypothetical protein